MLGDPKKLAEYLAEERIFAAWVQFFHHFHSNSSLYSAMFGSKGSAWFQARMRIALSELLDSRVKWQRSDRPPGSIPVEAGKGFTAGVLHGIISFWIDGGMKYTPRQMAEWTLLFFRRGVVGVVGGPDEGARPPLR